MLLRWLVTQIYFLVSILTNTLHAKFKYKTVYYLLPETETVLFIFEISP